MVKVIVVDDEKKYQEQIKNIVNAISIKENIDLNLDFYESYTKKLNEAIENTDYHKIYILDIELNDKISGIKIADIIREKDWDSEIIFVTNHDKMFETVYRKSYCVFDFLEKFNDYENKLSKDIKLILKKNFDNKMFTYETRNINLQLYYRNILYIYRDNTERKLVIVTENNEYLVSYTIAEMLEHLDSRFRMCHRACILNKDHVVEYNWSKKYFKLDTGEEITMLSKMFKKGVLE